MSLVFRTLLPLSAAVAALIAMPDPASAAGEACTRDTDCADAELCLGQVCTVPETAPATCETECDYDEECVDGFCKTEGVACDNPAGRCWVEQDHGSCECLDGNGAGWSDGFNPDDPPEELDDAGLFDECTAVLADTCGTEPPSLPDSCQGNVLTECQAVVDTEVAANTDCGGNPPSSTIARVGECCDGFDAPGAQEYRTCMLQDVADVTCDLIETCEGDLDGDPEGAGTNDGEGEGDTDSGGAAGGGDEDESKSACTIGGGSPSALLLLGVLGLWRRRRR